MLLLESVLQELQIYFRTSDQDNLFQAVSRLFGRTLSDQVDLAQKAQAI